MDVANVLQPFIVTLQLFGIFYYKCSFNPLEIKIEKSKKLFKYCVFVNLLIISSTIFYIIRAGDRYVTSSKLPVYYATLEIFCKFIFYPANLLSIIFMFSKGKLICNILSRLHKILINLSPVKKSLTERLCISNVSIAIISIIICSVLELFLSPHKEFFEWEFLFRIIKELSATGAFIHSVMFIRLMETLFDITNRLLNDMKYRKINEEEVFELLRADDNIMDLVEDIKYLYSLVNITVILKTFFEGIFSIPSLVNHFTVDRAVFHVNSFLFCIYKIFLLSFSGKRVKEKVS